LSRPSESLIRRLALREPTQTEADIQGDIRSFLTGGYLSLQPDQVVRSEEQTGDGTRRRLDIAVGHAVIEVKKDLRPKGILSEAEKQLAGYVQTRIDQNGTRYVGILTDGATWRLYHLVNGQLEMVAELDISSSRDGAERLAAWLEAVLATETAIKPTPDAIRRRLGSSSTAHQLDHASLTALYEASKSNPEVALKRDLWAALLRTACGSGFDDNEQLFIDHTLLVISAEIIAHSVLGFDVSVAGSIQPSDLTTGVQFASSQIYGVVEEDFFDWVLIAPGGEQFIRTLADRLSRFDWGSSQIEHDVLKVLYESVIRPEERAQLGEYYTPDWLADRMVAEHIPAPLDTKMLDPSCGSGTFLFHAIRAYLVAADQQGIANGEAVAGVVNHVYGMDVHPVAVTLARVTYLLAIGQHRLAADDRGPISVPVYLGDSLQWEQHREILSDADAVTIHTAGEDLVSGGGGMLFADDLKFPRSILHDAGQFDRLVSAFTDKAADISKRSDTDVIVATLRQFAVPDTDHDTLVSTFGVLRHLRRSGRDHIWGYYVRNLIRPIWLAESDNRVDVLIGNPPWLAYSKMTAAMQQRFTELSRQRGLITGRRGVSGRDLSTLFVVRCAELYLRSEGRLSFVMPHGTLTRQPHDRFRSGDWGHDGGELDATMLTAWDLSRAATGFPMTSCVIAADLTPGTHRRIPATAQAWTTTGAASNVTWAQMSHRTTTSDKALRTTSEHDAPQHSPYKARFRQGAILVPRVLTFVQEVAAGPLGAGQGRVHVRSRRSALEKAPWKSVPSFQGVVEKAFVRPVHLGETILPYRTLEPLKAVIPIHPKGDRLLESSEIAQYPALEQHWNSVEAAWAEHKKSSDKSTFLDRLNFHGQLSAQLPAPTHRVVYTKAGSRLTAARIADPEISIEMGLYWAACSSISEARYLQAILNSNTVLERVQPLQAIGLFGPRHFDKYVFSVPIPTFNPADADHQLLAQLGEKAEKVASEADIGSGSFQSKRKHVRARLFRDRLALSIEDAVERVVPEPVVSS